MSRPHLSHSDGPPRRVHDYVAGRLRHPELIERTVRVMSAMPPEVRDELMADAGFALAQADSVHDGRQLPLSGPGGLNRPGRTVVLRADRLVGQDAGWVCYIIAHELAHAWLRNEGRWHGEDPELAADALAGAWGFPRPPGTRPRRLPLRLACHVVPGVPARPPAS